jgi:membrane protein
MRLPRSRALQWVKLFLASLGRSRTFGLAGEMAFWLFLSLIPLAAVAGLVVAKVAATRTEVVGPLLGTLPPAVRELIAGELGKVSAWNGGAVAPIAALTFFWLASSGIHAVFDGLELETESAPRPWWKKRALAVATSIALSIGVASVALLGAGIEWFQRLAQSTAAIDTLPAFATSAASTVFRLALAAVIAIASVSGLYFVGLPRRARRRMPILPGAVLAVGLQAALGLGYGFYVRTLGDGGAYQAGLAVIGVTLMALYLFSSALLIGVELNQILGARRFLKDSVHPAVVPPPPEAPGMVGCDDDHPAERAEPAPRVSIHSTPSHSTPSSPSMVGR